MTESWHDFAVMVGGASAALTGLLFVGVSLNRDVIGRHPSLLAAAAQTLTLFTLPLVLCVLVLVPGQPSWALGTELLGAAVLTGVVLLVNDRRKQREVAHRHHRPVADRHADSVAWRLVDRRTPNVTTTALTAVAGVTVIAGAGGGLAWLVPAVLAALVGGVVNAWSFLVAPPVQG
ncbi:hypothetical protein ACXR2U_04450 [Jatrophihabitans sp. YIM 134969]